MICFSLPDESETRDEVRKIVQDLIKYACCDSKSRVAGDFCTNGVGSSACSFVASRSDTWCSFEEYYYAPPDYVRAYFPPGEAGESRFHTGGGITHGR